MVGSSAPEGSRDGIRLLHLIVLLFVRPDLVAHQITSVERRGDPRLSVKDNRQIRRIHQRRTETANLLSVLPVLPLGAGSSGSTHHSRSALKVPPTSLIDPR